MSERLQWFRMYSEAIDDEKLRLLAFEDRWHFVALLCCKAQGFLDEPGELMRRKVSVKLGIQIRELEEVARRLSEVGLIDRDTLQPNAWDKRQFVSDRDPTNSERQKRYREKQRVAKNNDMKRVNNALHNAPVTVLETETETDTDNSRTRNRSRGSRLQHENLPNDWAEFCRKERPDLNPSATFAGFRDYWIAMPGQKGVKVDWLATWRNWVRNQRKPANAPIDASRRFGGAI